MIFSINSMFIIYYDSIHYASWMQFQWSIKLCHYNLPKNLQILRLEHRFQRIVLEKALLNFMSFIYNCYRFLDVGVDSNTSPTYDINLIICVLFIVATCSLEVNADSNTTPVTNINYDSTYQLICDSTNSTGVTLTRYCAYKPITRRYGTVGDGLHCPGNLHLQFSSIKK